LGPEIGDNLPCPDIFNNRHDESCGMRLDLRRRGR
jgi:hypothetical protein